MATEVKEKVVVAPFGVEIDDSQNGDVVVQSIPGCRLRGALYAMKTSKNAKSGNEVIPKSRALMFSKFPSMPGMQLLVNPAKLTYKIVDPLFDNEELCGRIQNAMEQDGIRTGRTLRGVEPKTGTLDKDRMKSLCRELIWLVEGNHAKVFKGVLPKLETVDQLPGDYLLNLSNRFDAQQPRYEKDLEAWKRRLNSLGN